MKFTATFLAAAALFVSTATADDLTPEDIAKIKVFLSDVKANFSEYMNLYTSGGFKIPDNFIPVWRAMQTYTDESYTSLFTSLKMDQVNSALTAVPWYSSRLAPALVSIGGGGDAGPSAPASSEAPASSAAPASSEAPASSAAPSPSAAPASSAAAASSPAVQTFSGGADNLKASFGMAVAGVVGLLL